LLVHKALVIINPIPNTLDLHPVPASGIGVSLTGFGQDAEAYPLALTKLLRFFLATDYAEEPIFQFLKGEHDAPSRF
jgi:hypothetical protein